MPTPRRSSIVLASITRAPSAPHDGAITLQDLGKQPVPVGKRGALHRVPDVLDAQLTSALGLLARVLAPFVAAELDRVSGAGKNDEWIDQTCSPLGRRSHCVLARRGTLPARKVGRRWLVRRADLAAFIAAHGHAPQLPEETDAEAADLEAGVRAVAAECGMALYAGARAPRKVRH